MSLRSITLAAALGLSGTACITPYGIEPATGGTVGTSSSGALTMRIDPNAWHGVPLDLETYLTPMAIDIVSRQPEAIWISYGDFALVDDWGVRYRAITPYHERARPPLAPTGASTVPAMAVPPPVKTAPPAPVAPPPAPIPLDRNEVLDDSWQKDFGPALGVQPTSGRPWSGEIFLAGYGPQTAGRFDRGLGGPSEPTLLPTRAGAAQLSYGPFVDSWDERYCPTAPSYDVLRFGLPERVISAGDRVSGFVYFQTVTTHASRLELTWTARTTQGKAVASLRIPFVVD